MQFCAQLQMHNQHRDMKVRRLQKEILKNRRRCTEIRSTKNVSRNMAQRHQVPKMMSGQTTDRIICVDLQRKEVRAKM